MKKLIITIDLDRFGEDGVITAEDLRVAGVKTELEYWMDDVYCFPGLMLEGAEFELVDDKSDCAG